MMSTPGDCFAILIKETHKKKASSAIRKLNVHSYLFPANGDWLAVVTEMQSKADRNTYNIYRLDSKPPVLL
jgi:hypothetical protein